MDERSERLAMVLLEGFTLGALLGLIAMSAYLSNRRWADEWFRDLRTRYQQRKQFRRNAVPPRTRAEREAADAANNA